MLIGDRLRGIREAKGLSHGDIEERSGLKRADRQPLLHMAQKIARP